MNEPRTPWKVAHGAGVWWIVDADGEMICEAMDERYVNVLLAAPALLAACKIALDELRGDRLTGTHEDTCRQLESVIGHGGGRASPMSESRVAIVAGIEVFDRLTDDRNPCPECGTVFPRVVGTNEATGEGKLICAGCNTAYFAPPGQPLPSSR